MTDMNVKEITCPECERVWPRVSEQGVVTELYDKCYACLIAQVVKARDERQDAADYSVQNCSSCGGIAGKVEKCVSCGGRGWETVDKADAEPDQRVVYPH